MCKQGTLFTTYKVKVLPFRSDTKIWSSEVVFYESVVRGSYLVVVLGSVIFV